METCKVEVVCAVANEVCSVLGRPVGGGGGGDAGGAAAGGVAAGANQGNLHRVCENNLKTAIFPYKDFVREFANVAAGGASECEPVLKPFFAALLLSEGRPQDQ